MTYTNGYINKMTPNKIKEPIKETWYLLYSGSSCDGRGTPKYKERTLNRDYARVFLKKVRSTPYSFGHVIEINEKGDVFHPWEVE